MSPRLLLLLAALALPSGLFSQVVISQVYGGGGSANTSTSFRHDYIEIFNRGTAAVDLNGYSVQYQSSGGTSWSVIATLATQPRNLQPGQYFLVKVTNNTSSQAGADLPTPDVTSAAFAMSNGSAKVALVSSTTPITGNSNAVVFSSANPALVDLVGYGSNTAPVYEGSGPTGGLSITSAAVRRDGGCRDNNDNAGDFQVTTPAPRTTGTTLAPCGAAAPLSILTNGSQSAQVNNAFNLALQGTGGSGSGYTFALAPGSNPLPGFLTLSANGLLSGTPTSTAGSPFTFSIRVTDSANQTADKAFTLTVNEAGTCNGTATNPLRTISEVQGSGSASPFVTIPSGATGPVSGAKATISGIVTAVKSNGYFLQMAAPGDNNPATSDGILVFTGSGQVPTQAVVGNVVCVAGTIQEYIAAAGSPPVTEFGLPTAITVLGTGATLPAPIVLSTSDTNPAGGLDLLEKYEGMRVQVNSLQVVGPTSGTINESSATVSSNGQFFGVITGVPRPFREPGIAAGTPLPTGAPANIPVWDTNPERLLIDSRIIANAPIDVTAGATVSNIVGPLDYLNLTYTIDIDGTVQPVVTGLVSATPVPAPTTGELTVASFNMERFFNTTNDGTGEPVLTTTAFNNRLNKASLAIRNVLNSPDIIGVEEMENVSTLQTLANKVNSDSVAAGLPNPYYQGFVAEGNDVGGIDVGFLVKTSRVQVKDVVQYGKDTTYTPPNGTPALLNDRPPLVLRASAIRAGAVDPLPLTVIANHLRSLIDVELTDGTGDRVRAKRRAQAEYLANLIQARQQADPNENIVVLGDFNAFNLNDGYVDVIGTIKGQPTPADQVVLASSDLVNPDLTDLIDQLPSDQRYTYVQDGSAQVLDHVLVNPNALAKVSRFAVARNDADFPRSYYADPNRPERLTDHDIPIAYFTLPEAAPAGAVDVTANVSAVSSAFLLNRATRLYVGTIRVTNTSSQAISGPIQVAIGNLPSGITVANRAGTTPGGLPYLTVPGVTSLAPGETATVQLQLSDPSAAPISFTMTVYSGAF